MSSWFTPLEVATSARFATEAVIGALAERLALPLDARSQTKKVIAGAHPDLLLRAMEILGTKNAPESPTGAEQQFPPDAAWFDEDVILAADPGNPTVGTWVESWLQGLTLHGAPQRGSDGEAARNGHHAPDPIPRLMLAAARHFGGYGFSGVARTGVDIAEPRDHVTVLDAADPRLPHWVTSHFRGHAWVVLGRVGGGAGDREVVLSMAVLKEPRGGVREISVGTIPQARGRGLARSVVAAAARAVINRGEYVVYNHDLHNAASARVAQACGLLPVARYHAVAQTVEIADRYGADTEVLRAQHDPDS